MMRCSIKLLHLFLHRLMKKWVFFFLLFPYIVWSQNLVPNCSFKENSGCPNLIINQLDIVSKWFTPSRGSPDYFNVCDNTGNVGIPNNFIGYQYASSEDAYVGIAMYAYFNQREYIAVRLESQLSSNKQYLLSLTLNLANEST